MLTKTEEECAKFADGYRKYEYLWVKDIGTCFEEVRF